MYIEVSFGTWPMKATALRNRVQWKLVRYRLSHIWEAMVEVGTGWAPDNDNDHYMGTRWTKAEKTRSTAHVGSTCVRVERF